MASSVAVRCALPRSAPARTVVLCDDGDRAWRPVPPSRCGARSLPARLRRVGVLAISRHRCRAVRRQDRDVRRMGGDDRTGVLATYRARWIGASGAGARRRHGEPSAGAAVHPGEPVAPCSLGDGEHRLRCPHREGACPGMDEAAGGELGVFGAEARGAIGHYTATHRQGGGGTGPVPDRLCPCAVEQSYPCRMGAWSGRVIDGARHGGVV